jgi:hypothetical protein
LVNGASAARGSRPSLSHHAYAGHARVASDGHLTEVALARISWLLSAASGSLIKSAGMATKQELAERDRLKAVFADRRGGCLEVIVAPEALT